MGRAKCLQDRLWLLRGRSGARLDVAVDVAVAVHVVQTLQHLLQDGRDDRLLQPLHEHNGLSITMPQPSARL